MITKPMLATSATLEELPYPCHVQYKYDGIRCIVQRGQLFTRSMKLVPNIQVWVALDPVLSLTAKTPALAFDGELVLYGVDGRPLGFNEVQSAIMSDDAPVPGLHYVVFDVITDLDKPYRARLADLDKYVYDVIAMDNVIDAGGVEAFDPETAASVVKWAFDDGFEGVIARKIDGAYKCGRSTLQEGLLLKVKVFADAEAEVIGFEPLVNKAGETVDTLGALLVHNGSVTFSVGTGFNAGDRLNIWKDRQNYLGKLITYTYQPHGTKDKPRFPVFKGFRDRRDL